MRESASTPAASDALKAVSSALARVQVNQLGSLPHGDAPAVLQIELPVLVRGEVYPLRLSIEPSKPRQRKGERACSVLIEVELPRAGALYARLALSGTELSATLWAEHETTRCELAERLPDLRSYLDEAGFAVVGLRIGRLAGRPPSVPSAGPLLDERA
jgi:hypothetical protein